MMPKRKTKKKTKDPDVLKPATPPPPLAAPSDGPVFTACFDDGIETKMSIYSSADEKKLDVARAVAVSKAAYSSRTKVPMAEITAAITYARFDNVRGMLLASYSAADLAKAVVA